MSRPATVALWDYPFVDVVERAVRKCFPSADVVRYAPEVCATLLGDGSADIALVPTTTLLTNADRFDVLPGFALSSWRYPFARIFLKNGLGRISPELVVPTEAGQEAFIASVILQEHYGVRILAVPTETPAGNDVNHLIVSRSPEADDSTLDLGQEWFELTNYPMVWGLLATQRSAATPDVAGAGPAAAAYCEGGRADAVAAAADHPVLGGFLKDELRFRLDDLAVASLTELADYLFYYAGTDEPAELNLVTAPDDGESEGEGDQLTV